MSPLIDNPAEFESWVTGCIAKHPLDTVRILADLCSAGLARGEASANDIGEYTLSQPNVIGSTFKVMRRLGFVKSDRIAKSDGKKRHAGLILVWTLTERWRAQAFMDRARALVVKQAGNGQLELAM